MNRWVLGALSLAAGVGLTAGVVALQSRPVVAPPAADKPPNVLVIVWDTVRADRLSLYGHDRPTTPRIDAFAESAVVFERASSPGIWTLPSHASVFTGLPPETTGADERWLWLDDHHLTMAEHFAAHGYGTFSMAANALLCKETNLVQGFRVPMNTYRGKVARMARAATQEKLIAGDRSQELAPAWEPPGHGAKNAEWNRAVFKEAAPLIGKAFLLWLERRSDRDAPFFAYLNMMEAHTPRLPSEEARRAVIGDPELIERGLTTDAGHINLHFYNFGVHDYSDAELEAINAVYDATLRDLDDATADLLEALERRGILDDTVVVLTSDHGENLGDHHLFNHRFSLWDSLVHVPLVVRHPAIEPRRVTEPVSTIDLFATLSRLTGLPVPGGIVQGDLLSDPSPAVTWLAEPLRREIETVKQVHPEVEVEPWLRSGHAVVDEGHKLVRLSDGTRDVYDLAADPGELTPLDDEERAAALEGTLEAWLATVAPYDPSQRTEADDPARVRASQQELRKQLEAIGYTTPDE